MKYISGLHSLNLPCKLNTDGDWHTSALSWKDLCIMDTDSSPFGNYGIENGRCIPEHKGTYNVANHLRAILDMLVIGRYDLISGFKRNFFSTDEYDEELFQKVQTILPNEKVNKAMHKEYGRRWRLWIGENNMVR